MLSVCRAVPTPTLPPPPARPGVWRRRRRGGGGRLSRFALLSLPLIALDRLWDCDGPAPDSAGHGEKGRRSDCDGQAVRLGPDWRSDSDGLAIRLKRSDWDGRSSSTGDWTWTCAVALVAAGCCRALLLNVRDERYGTREAIEFRIFHHERAVAGALLLNGGGGLDKDEAMAFKCFSQSAE